MVISNRTLATLAATVLLAACQSISPSDQSAASVKEGDTKFIESLPPGVSTAFTKSGELWMVLTSKAKLTKVGDGLKNIPFEQRGNYIVVPAAYKRLYMQFDDQSVEAMFLN